jgi:hypothetical protein
MPARKKPRVNLELVPEKDFRPTSLSPDENSLFKNILEEIELGRNDIIGHGNHAKKFGPVIKLRRGVSVFWKLAWDLDLFIDFIQKEMFDRKTEFEPLCEDWGVPMEIKFSQVRKDRKLHKEDAEIIFCAAAQLRGSKDLGAFLAEYIKYCDRECAFNDQKQRIRGVKGFESVANELIQKYEAQAAHEQPKYLLHQLLLRRTFTSQKTSCSPGEINLDPYDHKSIELIGREQQIEQLNAFLEDPAQFLILPVIGPSGAGKTRLVTQWISEHVGSDWHAGILEDPSDATARDWHLQKNTLIVIDYLFRYISAIQLIVRKAKLVSENRKIRLILIDHVLPDMTADVSMSFIDEALAPDARSRVDIGPYLLPEMRISDVQNRLELLRAIIAQTSAHEEFSERVSEGAKLLVVNTTSEKSSTNDLCFSAAAQPLFAILVGQAIARGIPIKNWKRRDVINYYLKNERRLPWKHLKNGEWVGSFVAASTIRGGVSFVELFSALPESVQLSASERSLIVRHCNQIVSSKDEEHLIPFRPDILGENFFLIFFGEYGRVRSVNECFYHQVFSANPNESIWNACREFIIRLTRNMLNTDLDDEKLGTDWSTVLEFFNINSLLLDSKIKTFIAVTGVEMAFQMAELVEQRTRGSSQP